MHPMRKLVFAALVVVPGLSLASAPVLRSARASASTPRLPRYGRKARNFNALNTCHPAVARDAIVASSNNQPGAERKLTLGNGGTVDEKLLSFDDAHRRFSYTIVGGVLPVSDYTSTFRVTPVGKDSARVTWSGTFKRKDTGAKPAADASDATRALPRRRRCAQLRWRSSIASRYGSFRWP